MVGAWPLCLDFGESKEHAQFVDADIAHAKHS